ncbi:ATP-binding protein [Megasphaera elsdenii]|uniref:ATP-binding protein n=1 Tax=Megasphaera elsdenii TaxID=907 RepID=UPI00091B460A|nr:ATP-binding protein [Megasphaera elsdenii]SHK09425.1 ATP-dependent DNA helicase RecG [Megasphaera elsdenii]
MDIKDFQGIEASFLDYKISLEAEKPKSWLKSVSAFANTKGGHVLFGVTDKTHEAIGLDDVQKAASKIAEIISVRISPKVNYTIDTFPGIREGKFCLDLSIFPGPHYPYYYVHEQTRECYVRRGDRSEPATTLEINTLILKGMNQTYDALPTSYKLDDISFTLLGATFKQETGESFNLPQDAVSLGLTTPSGEVTNAGLLLCDQGVLRHSRVVCTHWKGKEKGAIDGDALDDQEFFGTSLIMLLSNTEAFIRNNSKNPWTIRGMRREENSDYPFKAVREVLVNALIHRDYQNIGAEVHVDMYDDRMEISSPGGMMNGSRIQDLDLSMVPSMRRNEIISDIFGRLHYMDRRGSGIRRIINSYTRFKIKPNFYSNEYFFLVSLPNRGVTSKIKHITEETQLTSGETQLTSGETQLTSGETQLTGEETQLTGEKMTLEVWKTSIRQKTENKFQPRTVDKLAKLMMIYEDKYPFNRQIVANRFEISENAASRILKRAIDCGIVRKEKKGVYYFQFP